MELRDIPIKLDRLTGGFEVRAKEEIFVQKFNNGVECVQKFTIANEMESIQNALLILNTKKSLPQRTEAGIGIKV